MPIYQFTATDQSEHLLRGHLKLQMKNKRWLNWLNMDLLFPALFQSVILSCLQHSKLLSPITEAAQMVDDKPEVGRKPSKAEKKISQLNQKRKKVDYLRLRLVVDPPRGHFNFYSSNVHTSSCGFTSFEKLGGYDQATGKKAEI